VVYHFGEYSLDSARRELRCGTSLVAVEPQVFDVLQFLLCNRQRVVSKDDLFAAVWGGRIVSESTLSSRITAVRHAIGDTGDEQRFIKTLPRKGVRFVGDVREDEETTRIAATSIIMEPSRAAFAIPDKPSIAVLPFTSMNGDSDQEYFADGMIEEIITALSRMRWLFVIARNSSFAYKGRNVDVKQVGRELGVRYVLEGSVRMAGNRVRITGQLIDAPSGAHLWADRFEGTLEHIFDLQDRVTENVVGAIAPTLERAEIDRVKQKPTENLKAYDYFIRGLAGVRQWTKEGNDNALSNFYRAIEVDPDFASAYGWAARSYVQRRAGGWVSNLQHTIAEADRLARRAVVLGKDDAVALCTAGFAIADLVEDMEYGNKLIDQGLTLNPNLACGWLFSGWVKASLHEPELAIEHVNRAMRLSPNDPQIFSMHACLGLAHFVADRYNQSLSYAEIAVREDPGTLLPPCIAAASAALAARFGEAQKAMIDLRQIAPALRLSDLRTLQPFRRADDYAKWQEGLRLAGLPE
jgi:TolB-like protein